MKYLLLLLTSLLVCSPLYAADESVQYVRLTKAMVLNYGEPSLNRLKYLKVAVDVRVPDADSADLVEYHLPALKDALMMVFTSAEEEVVKSSTGKEELRLMALDAVQSVLTSEEGEPVVEDLLFSAFVVQR